ncbi:hypothetical protein EYC84_007271 [Monilinia fructicola]|uniref:Uncharacterized protein n=1 Tax=Monilinia fructicola TaxID=38448 RepID=A0A5M9K8V3_MONFR|nr:hypothetical protein EYC84_007271 [Monilinia fructicola]
MNDDRTDEMGAQHSDAPPNHRNYFQGHVSNCGRYFILTLDVFVNCYYFLAPEYPYSQNHSNPGGNPSQIHQSIQCIGGMRYDFFVVVGMI